jgi:hypothetical protein
LPNQGQFTLELKAGLLPEKFFLLGSDRPTKRALALRAYQKPPLGPAARLLILQRF